MKKKAKKRNRPVIIAATVIISIAAVISAFYVVKSFYTGLYGRYVYRSEKNIDLRDSGITDLTDLMRLDAPDTIDLRGNPVTAEQFETIAEKFPACDILWDVPLSSGSYDCLSESLSPVSFEQSDIELLKYLKKLSILDLSDSGVSRELVYDVRAAAPGCTVIWGTELLGNSYPKDTETLVLDGADLNAEDLHTVVSGLEYIKEVTINDCRLSVEDQIELKNDYPGIHFTWDVELFGKRFPNDASALSFDIDSKDELNELEKAGELFERCETIDLNGRLLDMDDIAELRECFGGAAVLCNFSFLNRTISTAETELDFSGIKNIEISAFDKVTAAMPYLSKVVMCYCGIPDETMDELNHKYDGVRFVWTVYVTRYYQLRTDITYFCASDRPEAGYVAISLNDEEIQPLKYCTDLIALDLGHMHYHNCDFVKDMKQLKYLIVSCGYVNDISAVSELENLYYFEMAFSDVTDITPVLSCKNLRCLNINACHAYDREIIAQMDYLEYLFYTTNEMPAEDVEWIKNALPDTYCYVYDSIQDRYGHEWRSIPAYYEMRDIFHMFY